MRGHAGPLDGIYLRSMMGHRLSTADPKRIGVSNPCSLLHTTRIAEMSIHKSDGIYYPHFNGLPQLPQNLDLGTASVR